MLGIIIGVASVVVMVSVVSGQNKRNMEYYEKMGDNKIDVSASSYTGQDMDQILNDFVLRMGDIVVGITPNIQLYGEEMLVKYGAKTYSTQNYENWEEMIQIVLGNDKYGVCNNYELGGGRELSYLDIQGENNVCVLGGGLKQMLFDYTDPVGETITLNGMPYLVIGWYQQKDIEYYPEVDNILLLPYTLNRTLNKNQTISSWTVKAASSAATTQVITQLDGFLNGMFPMDETGMRQGGNFSVYSDNSWQEQMQEANLMQTMVMGGIAAISLLVGGIGIMNIMLVTVTERTREIGIRKAIGAERRSIIVQFLIEASMLCGIGGILGIFIGYLGTLIVGKLLLNMILYPSMLITVGAFVFSVALGIGFGLYPAIKASGLQPVNALRAE